MPTAFLVAGCILGLLCGGCSSGTNKSSGGGEASGSGKAFMDVKRQIPPRLEWNRDLFSRSGGTLTFRVTSQGPFAVTIVTDKAYQAMQRGDRKAFSKEDVLLTIDSKEPSFDGKVTVPAGRSWFIIENQTEKKVEMHLQCFAP
jgi:hypothetical protein